MRPPSSSSSTPFPQPSPANKTTLPLRSLTRTLSKQFSVLRKMCLDVPVEEWKTPSNRFRNEQTFGHPRSAKTFLWNSTPSAKAIHILSRPCGRLRNYGNTVLTCLLWYIELGNVPHNSRATGVRAMRPTPCTLHAHHCVHSHSECSEVASEQGQRRR